MKLFPIYILFVLMLFSCQQDVSNESSISAIFSVDDGENILARQEYEQMRLADPSSGEIPLNIQLNEYNYLQSFPLTKSQSGLEWQSRGPENVGGRTRALAIDLANENRILAGGVSGGLWISENGGESFEKATTSLMLHSVTSIAQDPRTGFQNTWYYGTGELSGNSADLPGHGIYKSIDNGLTWALLENTFNDSANIVSSLGDFLYVQDVQVNPSNGDVVVATFAGVFLSQNGGDSWVNVLVADGSPNGFGYLNFGNQISVDVNANGVYYATLSSDAQDAGIWRSIDGLVWEDITPNGFPSAFRRIESASNPLDLNEVMFIADATTNPSIDNHELWLYTYLSGAGSGVGGSWEDRSINLPDGDCLGFYDFNFGYFQSQNSYDLLIAYHPSQADVLFIGGTNLYRSTDAFQSNNNYQWIGGYQCDAVNPSNYVWPNHHPDNHLVKFLPSNDDVMISAHDGGLSITSDCLSNSITWESLNNGYGTSQFYTVTIEQGDVDNDIIVGGLQDNGTWHTNSANPLQAWQTTFYGDGAYCAIADNRESYYVSWQGGKTFKFDIEDDGQINGLTRIDPIGGADYLFINPFILDPNNSNTMYLTVGSKLWRNDSLNVIPIINDEYNAISQGWEEITQSSSNSSLSSGNFITALAMSENNSDVIYYASYRNTVNPTSLVFKLSGLQSGNYVKELLPKGSMPNAYVSSIEVNPSDENEVFITHSNYEVKSIFHSTDAGSTWESISANLEENPDGSGAGPSINWFHLYQDDLDTFYMVGTTSGLFLTQELEGDNTVWEREAVDEIGNVPVAMITSRTFDKNIVVATHGGGIFSTKYIDVGIGDKEGELNDLSLGYPYPNPSADKINLTFMLNTPQNIKVSCYDVLGNLIEIVEEESYNAGPVELKWKVNSYTPGMYFITVNNGKQNFTRSFVVKR